MPWYNPSTWIDAHPAAVNGFQAQTAGAGAGTDQLNERDYQAWLSQTMGQQAGLYNQQGALAGDLRAEAAGTGPGADLINQQMAIGTGQNIQQQAGAVASLRGLDPAMQARLIAQQGATIQQQAVGQTNEAQMQNRIAAREQLAGVYGQQQAGNISALGLGVQGSQGQNALNLNNQQGAQTTNANVANQNAGLQESYNQRADATAAEGRAIGGQILGGAAKIGAMAAFSHGGLVTGTPPPKDGPQDTVPSMLKVGEVVVPTEIVDDPEAVVAFIKAMKKHKKQSHGTKEAR